MPKMTANRTLGSRPRSNLGIKRGHFLVPRARTGTKPPPPPEKRGNIGPIVWVLSARLLKSLAGGTYAQTSKHPQTCSLNARDGSSQPSEGVGLRV